MRKVIPTDASLIPAGAQCVFKGKIFDVYHWDQELFDGSFAVFEMLKRPDTATVIAVVDDKIVVLEDEQPNRGVKLTFPGGRFDEDDETTTAAAQRELHEEVGLTLPHWKLVEVRQPQAKNEWFIHTFVAWGDPVWEEAHVDGGERIKMELKKLADVKQLVAENKGFLGENSRLFDHCETIDDVIAISEYQGVFVDS